MQGGTWQPLLSANHVGYLHQVVVYDISQMIGRQFVRTLIQYLVVYNVTHDTYIAPDEVVDMHFDTRLYAKTHYVLCAVGY